MLLTLKPVWKTNYSHKTAPILIGKKRKHASEVLAALALLGPSTTREIARFVLKKSPDYDYDTVRGNDARVREQIYYNLLHGRLRKSKSQGKYAGLVAEKYLINVGKRVNEKAKEVTLYSLTLKGCLFALGFEFNDDELILFIRNAAKNHIYFAYVNSILQKTSISFVKQFFIGPIQRLIKTNRISLYDDIIFYFSNIAEAIEYELHWRMTGALDLMGPIVAERFPEFKEFLAKKEVEIMMDNTFYSEKEHSDDWIDRMKNYFYPDETERYFFEIYSDKIPEMNLLYKIMSRIHFVYFNAIDPGGKIPRFTNRLPSHSKEWKDHFKRNRLPFQPFKGIMTGLEYKKYLKQKKKK